MSDVSVNVNLVSEATVIGRCTLTFPERPPWFILADDDELGRLNVRGPDLFDCLSQIRLKAERSGYRLACNGSRIDVWPSGMARQMSGGMKAYQLSSSSSHPKLVRIFDEAPIEKLATVEEQKRWCAEFIRRTLR
jgi:hypothetical protein